VKNLLGLLTSRGVFVEFALGIEMEIPALRIAEAIYSADCPCLAMTDWNGKPARFFSGNAQNIILNKFLHLLNSVL